MASERIQRRIDTLLDEADAAAAQGDWATVAARATAVEVFEPGNTEAAEYLAAAARGIPTTEETVPAASLEPTPTTTTEPESFANGRYLIKKFLGEGGKKKVYLAHDTLLDRDVAFALIKTEGLDVVGRARITREAQGMGRLGSHPHIVSVFDLGETNGQPFMVTELMGGGDVEGLLEKAGDALPLERSLEIARAVCEGLEFAHANGIVHRDLKPGNVWLTADGIAKIGDFGLAVALDRSRLTMHGMMVGTVSYMPPEQALGGEVTPQSDLYSLGAMLYEMVTGKPPFVGSNATVIISQHINMPPVAPSWQTEHCPPDLEELILRLLQKLPSARPASARETLQALDRVDTTQKSASHSDSNVLDRLTRGVFVGREKELERLRKAFDEAFAGHGGLVMLVGEPGIGKTRTTQELETYARMRGATVLWGRTHESAGAPPYWPWIQAGNQWVASGDGGDDALSLAPDVISELSRIFPILRQQPNFVEPQPVDDPEVAQFRLFDAYATFLRAVSGRSPLVVAIDDLHWADQPTLLLLQHVARELGRSRILIVGNYRDTDITRQSPLAGALAALNHEASFERIVLRGLSREEVAAYIRAKAHTEPVREVLDRIYEETEGNAFFLSEVVNLMAEEGTLNKDSVSDIAIPDGVRETLGRRLNRLSPETNELLQVATIIGREFSYATLTLLGDRDEEQLLKLIEEAIEARVIEELPQPGRYRFTHAQMQETLLGELSTTRRVRLHGQVGEALEKSLGVRADQQAPRLAQHFVEAATLAPRFLEKAVHYSVLSGRQAVEQAAYPDAVRHFRAALTAREGRAVDDDMADLLFDLGRACDATVEYREAWRSFQQAFGHYAACGNVARAVDVAEFAGSSEFHVVPAQTEMIERALTLVDEGSAEYGRLQAALGFSAGMQGDDVRAQGAFTRTREVATRLGLPRLELNGLQLEMAVDVSQVRWEAAIGKAERVIELAHELNDPIAESNGHFCATIKGRVGDLSGGRHHADACRALAESSRIWGPIVSATFIQGTFAVCAGDWAAARAAFARGLELDPRDARLLDESAVTELFVGDLAAAEEYIGRLVDVMKTERPGSSLAAATVAYVLPLANLLADRPEAPELVAQAAGAVLSSPIPAPPLIVGIVRRGLAMEAFLHRDREAAIAQLTPLAPFSGRATGSLAFDHIRGLLFVTLGKVDEAVEAFESALQMQQAGYRPGYAWAAYDCARVLLERGGEGDDERARALLDEAALIAQELGMKPLLERVLMKKEILKA